jgi:HlyD family type I secretion membrane fusion protein
MKLDLQPIRQNYVAPNFGSDDRVPIDPRLEKRLRRPMVMGAAVIGVLVLGLSLWASLTPLSSGITAMAEVRVESNLKTLRHQETGIVRQILVHEGQHVSAGQPLIVFDDVAPKAARDVLQNQADSLMVQAARLNAEATGAPAIQFPPEVLSRASDPAVAQMMRDQQFLFTSRLQLFQSQSSVLDQRQEQIQNQVEGDKAQIVSVDEQLKLTKEEMSGYQTLYDKGFAPKSLILRYQRSVADLDGKKGSLLADVARLHQQMGETSMNRAALRDQRQSQSASDLRDSQSKIADTLPRLTAAKQSLDETVVRAPADGYVFNLSQFTVGGVAGAGEALMQIVPANTPLIITASVKPTDIEEVHEGMDARVRVTGLNPRWFNPMKAKVVLVSHDRTTNEKSGASFYRVDLRIDPDELKNMKHGVQITPGMPASAMIVTGQRTIMGFLVSPITDTLSHAFREQ